jgi:COPII coat assembly protein SEC16
VDTFNKGGGGGGANAFGVATSYSKPAAPSMSGAKFLVPTPVNVASEQMAELGAHSETARQDESSSSPAMETSFSSPPSLIQMQSSIPRYPSGDNIPRYPSGDNIPRYPSMDNVSSPTGSINSSMSRSRASSWSGTYPEQLSSTAASRSADGQMTQSPSMPGRRPPLSRSNSASSSAQLNGLGEDLHEVEL